MLVSPTCTRPSTRAAATPTVAQSCARRSILRYVPACTFGTRISVSTSCACERRDEHAGEELCRGDRPLAARPARDELGVEREHDRREVGRRVAVRDRTADRAAVAHLRVADPGGGLPDQRAVLREHRIAHELCVPRERADRDPVAVVADVAQLVEPADVDEQRRTREAQAHERNERVPAGEELRVLVAAEQRDRLVDAPRALVLESGGDHVPARAAACTARTMLWYPVQRQRLPSSPCADLVFGRIGVLLQQRDRRHHEPGRAVAALQCVLLVERLLHRVELVAVREALDRRHLAAVCLHREHRARLDRLAVEQHRARAARGRVAADVRPLQSELLAQEVREELPRLDVRFAARAVHGDRDPRHAFAS